MSERPSSPSPFVMRAEDIQGRSQELMENPFVPNSQVRGVIFTDSIHLQRTKVSMVRVPKGETVFELHLHSFEEEWFYVISGRALLQVNNETIEIRAGDFVGFPAPSAAHKLWNPFDEDAVLLGAQEQREVEFLDFPERGERFVRAKGKLSAFPLNAERKVHITRPPSTP